jgi:hypothetical protein
MSWQPAAVEAAKRAYAEAVEHNWRPHVETTIPPMESALRAALPLIEVTPGMQLEAEQTYNLGRSFAERIHLALRAMLTHCAKEKSP